VTAGSVTTPRGPGTVSYDNGGTRTFRFVGLTWSGTQHIVTL
jgi:hypothetical protein